MPDVNPLPHHLPSPARQVVAQRNAAANEFDVTVVCENGEVYHSWYRGANGWQGPERIFTTP